MAKTETLFPIHPQHSPGPLARAAAQAPLHSTGCLTEYRPLPTRTLISKVVSRRGLPFTHAINPYRGCEFACRYCYARYTHEFLEFHDPVDFERKIYFKQNVEALATRELARLKPGTQIALGTATDPYQPLERSEHVTRSILQAFARTRGFSLGIVTKSTLLLRDLDLLTQVARRHTLTIHITITTLNHGLARILEPRAPRPDLRVQALARLRQAGLRAGVLCSPIMPAINDSPASMRAVARMAAEADACFFAAGALFLKPCSQPTFFAFVAEHFPAQLENYKRRYGSNAFAAPQYRQRIADLVAALRREFKLGDRFGGRSGLAILPAPQLEQQPWLPFPVAGKATSA